MSWDLESLENKKLIRKNFNSSSPSSNLNFLLYYLIGNLCFNHPMFSRYTAMCLPYEFTTSPLIYQMTGIRIIRFSINTGISDNCFSKSPYSKYAFMSLASPLFNINHISHIHLVGNSDMIFNFMHTISRIGATSCVELEIESLGSSSSSPIDLGLFLYDCITCSDKCKLMKVCNNLKYLIKSGSLSSLISLISSRRYVYPYLYILDSDLKSLTDSDFICLSKHFNKIYILLEHPDVSDIEYILEKLKNNNILNIKFKPLGDAWRDYLLGHNSIEFNNYNSYSFEEPIDLDPDGVLCRAHQDGTYFYDEFLDYRDDYKDIVDSNIYHLVYNYF